MPKRNLTIEITETGVIKMESGSMEGIGHNTVDQFMKRVADGLNCQPEIVQLKPDHTHTHNHSHEHKHLKQ